MKYIDAEKLIAEIKRQQRNLTLLATKTEQVSVRRDCALQNGAYDYILGIITSLQQEQPEVDLEKEAVSFCFDNGINISPRQAKNIASHFAEWGAIHLNARKEE